MKHDVSGFSLDDVRALATQSRRDAQLAMVLADDYAQLAAYMSDRGITHVDEMGAEETERALGPGHVELARPAADTLVARCCATDALRSEIANATGKYAGGYHGDDMTAIHANATLGCAIKRHPDHALTQPSLLRGPR